MSSTKKRSQTSDVKIASAFSLEYALLVLAASLTIFSQMIPALSAPYLVCWLALLLLCLRRTLSNSLSKQAIFFMVSLLFSGAIASVSVLISGEVGYITGTFMLLAKTFMIYFVGHLMAASMSEADIDKFLKVYIFIALIYGLWIVYTYFPGFSVWLGSVTVIFSEKNSAGQILGVATVCCCWEACRTPLRRKRMLLLWVFLAVVSAACVVLLQCRTALIGLFLAIPLLLALYKKKRILILIAMIVAIAILSSSQLQGILLHSFMLDRFAGADLNTVSSGRIGLWDQATATISNNLAFGVGSYYVDNFWLNTLANAGLIGALPFFAVWIHRCASNLKNCWVERGKNHNSLRILALVLTLFYIVECMLEAFPPFGPGACSFVFWLLCGYLDQTACEKKARR